MQRNVALKIEKKDKNKNILMFEYNVLNCLKGNLRRFAKGLYRSEARVQRLRFRQEPRVEPDSHGPPW